MLSVSPTGGDGEAFDLLLISEPDPVVRARYGLRLEISKFFSKAAEMTIPVERRHRRGAVPTPCPWPRQ